MTTSIKVKLYNNKKTVGHTEINNYVVIAHDSNNFEFNIISF